MRVTIAAPAKVNLWLRVGEPEPSGFHGISTLFCSLDLADTVVLRKADPGSGVQLETAFAPPLEARPDLGPVESNLAVRAARRFAERSPGVAVPHIRLVKRIPAGGGLGGGSSDAGAVLRALRRMHPGAMDGEALLDLAAEIGSDVPFFVRGVPAAVGTGRGERLTAVDPPPPRPVVLVLPPFVVGTTEAYAWLDESRRGAGTRSGALEEPPGPGAVSGFSWEDIAARAENDFEEPVFGRHPELREIRDALLSRGARPALLAGSGSTVFGVFADASAADSAARSLRSAYPSYRVLVTGTRTR